MSEYRIIKYWVDFFAHEGYRLEKKEKFLWWEYWSTVADDALGIHIGTWLRRYDCEVIDKSEVKG